MFRSRLSLASLAAFVLASGSVPVHAQILLPPAVEHFAECTTSTTQMLVLPEVLAGRKKLLPALPGPAQYEEILKTTARVEAASPLAAPARLSVPLFEDLTRRALRDILRPGAELMRNQQLRLMSMAGQVRFIDDSIIAAASLNSARKQHIAALQSANWPTRLEFAFLVSTEQPSECDDGLYSGYKQRVERDFGAYRFGEPYRLLTLSFRNREPSLPIEAKSWSDDVCTPLPPANEGGISGCLLSRSYAFQGFLTVTEAERVTLAANLTEAQIGGFHDRIATLSQAFVGRRPIFVQAYGAARAQVQADVALHAVALENERNDLIQWRGMIDLEASEIAELRAAITLTLSQQSDLTGSIARAEAQRLATVTSLSRTRADLETLELQLFSLDAELIALDRRIEALTIECGGATYVECTDVMARDIYDKLLFQLFEAVRQKSERLFAATSEFERVTVVEMALEDQQDKLRAELFLQNADLVDLRIKLDQQRAEEIRRNEIWLAEEAEWTELDIGNQNDAKLAAELLSLPTID